jgi:hypothetical protein
VLAGIDSLRLQPSTEEDAARYSKDAKSLALILRTDYSGAAKLMSGESRVFFEEEEKKIAAALSRLEQSPGDLGQRLELAESLISFARTGRFTVGFTSYCWDLWGEASTPEQRVAALSLLGRIYERDEDQETARILYSAGMRLSSEMSTVDPDRQALLLSAVVRKCACLLSLGGDHRSSYGLCAGWPCIFCREFIDFSGQELASLECDLTFVGMECELFGHEPGSFTGAAKKVNKGKPEAAHQRTGAKG